jgi:hypothetical protein
MPGDGVGRCREMRVEDRAQPLALVAVRRLAEEPVLERRQLLDRGTGAVDPIAAALLVVGIGSRAQDLPCAVDVLVVGVLDADVVGRLRLALIDREQAVRRLPEPLAGDLQVLRPAALA